MSSVTSVTQPASQTVQAAPEQVAAAKATQAPKAEAPPSIPPETSAARMTDILRSYGFKATAENRAMLALLLDNGFPLTRENIMRMNQALKLTESPEQALFLLLNKMRLTQSNKAQLQGLADGQTKITGQISRLLAAVEGLDDPALKQRILQILGKVNGDGQAGAAKPAQTAAGQSTAQPQAAGHAGTAQAGAGTTQPGAAQGQQAGTGGAQASTAGAAANASAPVAAGTTPGAANGMAAGSANNAVGGGTVNGQPNAAQPQTAPNAPANASQTNAAQPQQSAPASQPGAAQPGAAQSGVAQPGVVQQPNSAPPSANPQPETAPSQNPSAAQQTNTSAPGQNTAQPQPAAPGQNTAQATPPQQSAPEQSLAKTTLDFPQSEQAARAAQPEHARPDAPRLSFRLADSTPQDIDRFINNLRDALAETQQAVRQQANQTQNQSPAAERVLREAAALSEHIDFTAQIKNQMFVQLPVFYNGQETQTALYVYKDAKKNAAGGESGASSALIALETLSMGHFETYVQKASQSVNCQFRLRDKNVEQLVRAHIHELAAMLREYKYSLDAFSFLPLGEDYTLLDDPAMFDGEDETVPVSERAVFEGKA